jgi:hypothetical protein
MNNTGNQYKAEFFNLVYNYDAVIFEAVCCNRSRASESLAWS